MSIKLLQDLVHIANALDDAGFTKEAEDMDKLAVDYSERVPNPKYQNIFNSMGKILTDLMNSPDSEDYVKKAIPVIAERFREVFDEEYTVPAHGTYIPKGQEHAFVSEEHYSLALGHAETVRSIKDIDNELDNQDLTDEQRQSLERDRSGYLSAAQTNMNTLGELQKNDPQAHESVIKYIQQALGPNNKPGNEQDFGIYVDRRQNSPSRRSTDEGLSDPGRRLTDEEEGGQ